jgi:transposase InsO family protein
MTKLNNKRIKWIIKQVVNEGKKPKDLAPLYGVSVRRVQQLAKYYSDNQKFPVLDKSRRPKTFLSITQKSLIDEAYKETLLTPRLLYFELKRRGGYSPKNKIYDYMQSKGWVKNEPKKQKKRKRCRYQWPYSGDMLHADYHRTSVDHPHVIFWLDDRSRKILSGGEFESPNAENAIKTFKQAQKKLKELDWQVLTVNTDRGSAFVSNKTEGTSKFEKYCEEQGIKMIPCRRQNPQTNGKVERRWLEYDKHRWQFKTLQEWIDWHNNRLTTSLNIEEFETPNEAFIRNLPNITALFWKQNETRNQKTKK